MTGKTNGKEQFITIKEAAGILRVTPWTLWSWIKYRKKNAPPSRRFGPNLYRIPVDKFNEYLEGKR